MNDSMTARISRSPKYQKLKRTRSRYGWALSILMLIVYLTRHFYRAPLAAAS